MKAKSEQKSNPLLKIHVETTATVTDFQYNHNGSQLAVADSDGYVFIYHRQGDSFIKATSFRADEAAIWKLAWADPSLGDVLAIGSFKRKVAVFQLRNNVWSQIAYHELHEGSVNHVQWASSSYGCKLFSVGSDGSVALLQLKKNNWTSSAFFAHECSVTSLSVRSLALSETGEESSGYPLIATAAKDNTVKIWRHTSEIPQEKIDPQSRIYQQQAIFKVHKEAVRTVLWKERWAESTPAQYHLFTCSDDGSVKLTYFLDRQLKESATIAQFQSPVYRIAQSLTGNLLTVSVGGEQQTSYLFKEGESWSRWEQVEQLK